MISYFSSYLVKARKQHPHDNVYIEGTIFGSSLARPELGDFVMLKAILKLLFGLLILFITAIVVRYVVIPLIFQFIVLTLMFTVIFSIFDGPIRGPGMGWIAQLVEMLFKITLNIISFAFQQIAGIFTLANKPGNKREVHKYAVVLSQNDINQNYPTTFWVKGNIVPQPQEGDEVRIWVKRRRSDGRYFFQNGELTDRITGECKCLHIAEQPDY